MSDKDNVVPIVPNQPSWLEFKRLDSEKDCNAAAVFLSGNHKITAKTFHEKVGLNLLELVGTYVETAIVFAPEGPLFTKKVFPIISFVKEKGVWLARAHKFRTLCSQDLTRAWIKLEDWGEWVDTKYFRELKVVDTDGEDKENLLRLPLPVHQHQE